LETLPQVELKGDLCADLLSKTECFGIENGNLREDCPLSNWNETHPVQFLRQTTRQCLGGGPRNGILLPRSYYSGQWLKPRLRS